MNVVHESLIATLLLGMVGLGVGYAVTGEVETAFRFSLGMAALAPVGVFFFQFSLCVDVVKDRANTLLSTHPIAQIEAASPEREIVQDVRLVPLRSASSARAVRLVDGVREDDLAFFAVGCCSRGHARSRWMGVKLPSGKVLRDSKDYESLVMPLVKAGFIVGRGPRVSGSLVESNPDVIKRHLGLP